MNFKIDLTQNQQDLLQQINYPVENREYSKSDIRQCVTHIGEHVMSLSSKNNDLSNELMKYNDLTNFLIKNEK